MSCQSRPGVAMIMSGHLCSSRVCFWIDNPPTTTQHCNTFTIVTNHPLDSWEYQSLQAINCPDINIQTHNNYAFHNPLGNLNSGHNPESKAHKSAPLQLVFDAAIAKLLCRLVSRCFYKSICVCFYDNVELSRIRCNSRKSL